MSLGRGAAPLPARRVRAARPRAPTGSGRGGSGRSCARWRRWSSRSGIDEGYLVLADGDPREQAALVQQAIRGGCGCRARWAWRPARWCAKVASDMQQAGRDHVRPGRPARRSSWRRWRCAGCPGWGPRASAGWTALGVDTIGALAALRRRPHGVSAARAGWAGAARPRPRHRPAAGVSASRARRSRSPARRRSSATSPTAAELHAARAADGRRAGRLARRQRPGARARSPPSCATRTSRSPPARTRWRSASTTPSRSAIWPAGCSTARSTSGRARCGWSGVGVSGFRSTSS